MRQTPSGEAHPFPKNWIQSLIAYLKNHASQQEMSKYNTGINHFCKTANNCVMNENAALC